MLPVSFDMKCLPDQQVITSVTAVPGWSPSLQQFCIKVSAHNTLASVSSEIVQKQYPPDCQVLPEPTGTAALVAGLVTLLLLWRVGKR